MLLGDGPHDKRRRRVTLATATDTRTRAREWRDKALPDWWWAAAIVAAFCLYDVVPGLALSLVVLACAVVLCWRRLPLAVSLVPLATPFFMEPKRLTAHAAFSLGETAILVCAAASLPHLVASIIRRGRARQTEGVVGVGAGRLFSSPGAAIWLAGGVFFLAATAATLATPHVLLSQGTLDHIAQRQYRVVVVEPLLYAVLVAATLRADADKLRALAMLALSGLVVALLGLGQALFRPNTLTGAYYTGPAASSTQHPLHQITSVYGSPDNLGLLLDRAIPIAVLFGLSAWAVRDGEPWRRRVAFLLPWAATLAMAVAVVLSGSRGGIITAVVVAVGVVVAWTPRNGRQSVNVDRGDAITREKLEALPARFTTPGRSVIVVGAIAAIGTVVLAVWRIQHGASTTARFYLWGSALAMIRDHPLFGVGPDNFLYHYFDPNNVDPTVALCIPHIDWSRLPLPHYMNPASRFEPCLSHPHNVVLDAWLSTGLLGLCALVAVLVLSVRLMGTAWRADRSTATRTVLVGVGAILVATIGHGLVDNSIFVPDLAVAFWLAVALLAPLPHLREEQSARPSTRANGLASPFGK